MLSTSSKKMILILQTTEEVFKTETDVVRGGDAVKILPRRFGLPEFESLIDTRTRNDSSDLIKTPSIFLPITTYDCERGFFDMNLTITESRTLLTIENVSDFMFISIDGPPAEEFRPQPYVKVWLRDRSSAVSAPCGKVQKERNEEKDNS